MVYKNSWVLVRRLVFMVAAGLLAILFTGCPGGFNELLLGSPELSMTYDQDEVLAYEEDFSFTTTYTLTNTGGPTVRITAVDHGVASGMTDDLELVVTTNTFLPVSLAAEESVTITYAGYTANANPPYEDYIYDMPKAFGVYVDYTDASGESHEQSFTGNLFGRVTLQ